MNPAWLPLDIEPWEEKKLVCSDETFIQEKKDGIHIQIEHTNNIEVIGYNRRGERIRLPTNVIVEAIKLPRNTLIDGELLPGGKFVAFDIIRLNGVDLTGLGAYDRYTNLVA